MRSSSPSRWGPISLVASLQFTSGLLEQLGREALLEALAGAGEARAVGAAGEKRAGGVEGGGGGGQHGGQKGGDIWTGRHRRGPRPGKRINRRLPGGSP